MSEDEAILLIANIRHTHPSSVCICCRENNPLGNRGGHVQPLQFIASNSHNLLRPFPFFRPSPSRPAGRGCVVACRGAYHVNLPKVLRST